ESGMGCGQARYGNSIRRTAHVVQSDLVAESDRLRVAAVFAADADLQIGFDVPATLGADTHQLADAFGVQYLEGIIGKNFSIDITREEAARVITAQTKSRLGQIVCAERKEVCVLRNLVGRQSRSRQLDHRADRVFDLET